MNIFKVWSGNRDKKHYVGVYGNSDILKSLIISASIKLDKIGVKIVLEEDGTEIDEDFILEYVKLKTLLLLERGETWAPPSGMLMSCYCSFLKQELVPPNCKKRLLTDKQPEEKKESLIIEDNRCLNFLFE